MARKVLLNYWVTLRGGGSDIKEERLTAKVRKNTQVISRESLHPLTQNESVIKIRTYLKLSRVWVLAYLKKIIVL